VLIFPCLFLSGGASRFRYVTMPDGIATRAMTKMGWAPLLNKDETMRWKFPLLLFLTLPLLLSAPARAQYLWSGILDPSRAIDWTTAGVLGGIPARATVCTTESPGVTYTQINTDISNCSVGDVVYLSAGTYTLAGGIIMKSGITLRGAGADKTFLFFTRNTGCGGLFADICFEGAGGDYVGNLSYNWAVADWTAGYSEGTTTITLSNPNGTLATRPGVSVGKFIYLAQENSNADNGNFFVCDNATAPCADAGPSGFQIPIQKWQGGCTGGCGYLLGDVVQPTTANGHQYIVTVAGTASTTEPTWCTTAVCTVTDGTVTWKEDGPPTNSSQIQIVQVTAINGSSYTISPAIRGLNWSSSFSPIAWFNTSYLENAGIENLSIDSTNDGGFSGVGFFNAANCWMTGVRSIQTQRNHVWLDQATHITIENNYFYGSKSAASESYGVETAIGSDNLVANNIFQHVTAPILMSNGFGNVYVDNFTTDDYYEISANWLQQALAIGHGAGNQYNLYEGNQTSGVWNDIFHGTSGLQTIFRNQMNGWGPDLSSDTVAVQLYAYSREDNLIGNVLGQPGYDTVYQTQFGSGVQATIYDLGPGQTDAGVTVPADSLVASTLMRWGNYDVVTGAVRWCGNSSDPGWSTTCSSTSEVPTGLSVYANAVPASTTLPASFHFAAEPSFWRTPWGTPPWPAIGPDTAGGTGPGGYAYNIPAALCYANSPADSNYHQSFTVTGASWSSGTVTLTVSNTLTKGEQIIVSGINPSGYNGRFTTQTANSTKITYPIASNPATYVSGGTVALPDVILFNAGACYASLHSPAPPEHLNAIVH